MVFFLKSDEKVYRPLPDDVSSQSASEDNVLLDEQHPRWFSRRTITLRVQPPIILAATFTLAIYTALVVLATSAWWYQSRLHGPNVIDTPLRPYMHYEARFLEPMHKDVNGFKLMGYPSDKVDAAWNKLMRHFYTELPASLIEKLGRTEEAIRLPNGNYVGVYNMMHDLHCLKRVHQGFFPDIYLPNMTEEEKSHNLRHNLHCLEMIAEGIMCRPDTSPITSRWWANAILPTGNPRIEHECVNWERLVEHLEEKRIDPFEPGLLVHPKLGPIAPNGKDTVFSDRIGYQTKDTSLLVPEKPHDGGSLAA